eukprot:12916108-Prorocentrum_lima.AAC.1
MDVATSGRQEPRHTMSASSSQRFWYPKPRTDVQWQDIASSRITCPYQRQHAECLEELVPWATSQDLLSPHGGTLP